MEVSGIKSGFSVIFTEVSHNDMYCCIFIRIPKNQKGTYFPWHPENLQMKANLMVFFTCFTGSKSR